MKIIDRLIDKLDRKLTEERRDNPDNESVVGVFTFGRHIVRFVFRPIGCEIEIYNPILDTFLDRVSFHCEERVVRWGDIETESSNDWDEHGFRDEADYLKYKYE